MMSCDDVLCEQSNFKKWMRILRKNCPIDDMRLCLGLPCSINPIHNVSLVQEKKNNGLGYFSLRENLMNEELEAQRPISSPPILVVCDIHNLLF